jgi:uncharacterized protein
MPCYQQMASKFRQSLTEFIQKEAQPREKFGHQPRLYSLTRKVGEGLKYDDDVVFAAVWLHDLGVFVGHRPENLEELQRWDNTAYAMRETPAILERFGFPLEKIPLVVEIIRTHQPSQQPANLEGKILRDADILEQLGAIGILRTVSKVGRDTRFHDFTAAIKSLQKALSDLPAQLKIDSARKLAESRIEVLANFLAQVEFEAGSELY